MVPLLGSLAPLFRRLQPTPPASETATMQVTAVSGNTVAQLDEDELDRMVESGKVVRDLKRCLSAQVGCSRFRQRLLVDEMGELEDDFPIRPFPSVHLIILPFIAPDEKNQKELRSSCRKNHVAHLEKTASTTTGPEWERSIHCSPRRPFGSCAIVAGGWS